MPHKDCTCNSRTVDETFNNVIHSTDCELYESKYPQKDKLDELIEWVIDFMISLEPIDFERTIMLMMSITRYKFFF